MSDLTFKMVEDKVRELVKERPDFRYNPGGHEQCRYNADDLQPGCVFGQAFAALGVTIPEDLEGQGIREIFTWLGVPVSLKDRYWASDLQGNQDDGVPWGEALEGADFTRASFEV